MDFFKKLASFFSNAGNLGTENALFLSVKCNRCGEIIQARINLASDLSPEYGEGEKIAYYCRKVLVGNQRCFQQVEVRLTFDGHRKLIDRQVHGGSFVADSN
ncbi:MAG TPA: hypothetical protein VI451_14705 [Anaerolineales bacterium]|nr:hypothetical protein [Anaerolineales bacterium]